MTEKIAILFSGGIDSSLAALNMSYEGFDVYLLKYSTGTLHSKELYRIRYEEMKENNEKIKELIIQDISGLFRKIALFSLEEDFSKYSTSLICLGCRLAMHVQTIIYCKNNNIKLVADGSSKKQSYYCEQSNIALKLFEELYNEYGIKYINPIYNLSKKEIKYELFENGISIQSLEDTCLFSDTFSDAREDDISSYIKDKLNICKEYISKRITN